MVAHTSYDPPMPIPLWLGHFNSRFTNNLTRPMAGVMPFFGVVEHVGRKSGRRYRSPVNVFRHGDRFVFALTYGPDAQWVHNVLAAGGCTVVTRGKRIRLVEPRRFSDPQRRALPWIFRVPLGVLNVTEFLELRADKGDAPSFGSDDAESNAGRR
jgi:deazaflavin-dependent oxidoreductase (nitroreductase family)